MVTKTELQNGKAAVLRMLYPSRCVFCDKPVPGRTAMVHKACEEKVLPIRGARCFRCSAPLTEETKEYCDDCLRVRHFFDGGFAVYPYRSVQDSLYKLKYLKRQEYAAFYAQKIAAVFGKKILALHPDVLVPVPLFRSRLQKRGYNQAGLIAEHLGRLLHLPVSDTYVLRTRATTPQKTLDRTGRRNNLKNAFKLAENDVKLKTIVLVDDIYTTGATLDAVAHLFKAAGASNVFFVTAAIGSL